MITVNELRIGNWLNVNEDGQLVAHQLTCIGYNMDGYEGYSAHFRGRSCTLEDHFNDGELDVKGIPLTEEWLLKFGFEKSAEFKMNWFETKFLTNEGVDEIEEYVRLCINIESYSVFMISHNSDDLGHNLKAKCQYVNQLQNLYFALTNEELPLIND